MNDGDDEDDDDDDGGGGDDDDDDGGDDDDDDDDDDDVMSYHGYRKYFGNSGLSVKCDNGPCSNLYPWDYA